MAAEIQTKPMKNMKQSTRLHILALPSGPVPLASASLRARHSLTKDAWTTPGCAANGSYDSSFAAYDDPTSGNLIGGIVTNSAVAVSNGLFTTTVDFGSGVFTASDLWLEIAVAANSCSISGRRNSSQSSN